MSETRKIAAILVADVVGYSRLAGADEDRTLSRLRGLRSDLIDPAIAAHHGRIVKRTGDGNLIEFRSVVDAVRCAIEVQNGLIERNAGLSPERRIEFRVGIHLGDVVEERDGDLMGDGVNIAARLEGVAKPGAICLSEDAYRQVKGRLDLAVADLGPTQLKNIAEPIRVYSLQVGVPAQAKPAKLAGVRRSEKAFIARFARRDDCGVAHPDRGRRLVASQSKPACGGRDEGASAGRVKRDDAAGRGQASLNRRAAVRQSLKRPCSGLFRRRNHGESHHRPLAPQRGLRDRAQHRFHLQGQKRRRPGNRKELGVRYVLEGSVQRDPGRLRVNVQLIDAENGNHLWADRFDKPLADLFEMQDEIVARLANQLGTELISAEARRGQQAANPDAMDLYFQGMEWFNRGTNRENMDRARGFFERALALDPNNLDAMLGVGRVDYTVGAAFLSDDRPARLASAEATIAKVLSLRPNDALAHESLGGILIQTRRADQGIAELERALALDPNLAAAHGDIGFAKLFTGRDEEIEAHENEALRLSPHDYSAWLWLHAAGAGKMNLGADEEAVALFRRSIENNRTIPFEHFFLAAMLVNRGGQEEAQSEVKAGLALDPGFSIRRFRIGAEAQGDNPIYRARLERLIERMRKAGVPEG